MALFRCPTGNSGGGTPTVTVTTLDMTSATPITMDKAYSFVIVASYEASFPTYARYNNAVVSDYYSFGNGREMVFENVKQGDVLSVTTGLFSIVVNYIE